jgi:predicted site-specific integrase-resolvase
MSEILYDVARVIELELKNKMTDEGYEELASYLLRNNLKGKKTIEEMDEVVASLKESISTMRNKILHSLIQKYKVKLKEKKEKGDSVGTSVKGKTEPQKQMTQKDIMEVYKISRPTIKAWEKRGLPSYKVNNGKVHYYENEVSDFVKSHSRK